MGIFYSLHKALKNDDVETFKTKVWWSDYHTLDIVPEALSYRSPNIVNAILNNQTSFDIYRWYTIDRMFGVISRLPPHPNINTSVIFDHFSAIDCYCAKYRSVIQLIASHPELVMILLTRYHYNPNRITSYGESILQISIIHKHKELTDLLLRSNATNVSLCKYAPDGKLLLQLIREYDWIDTFNVFIHHPTFVADSNEKTLIDSIHSVA